MQGASGLCSVFNGERLDTILKPNSQLDAFKNVFGVKGSDELLLVNNNQRAITMLLDLHNSKIGHGQRSFLVKIALLKSLPLYIIPISIFRPSGDIAQSVRAQAS